MLPLLLLAAATVEVPKPIRGADCAALAKADPLKAVDVAKAWIADKGDLPARQCLGLAQAGLEQWQAATATFEDVAKDAELRHDRMAAVLWMQAGNAALAADEPVRSRNSLDRALRLKTMSAEMEGEVRLDRARAGVAANDLAGAKLDLVEATKLVPRDPLGWLLLATLNRRQKDLPGAVEAIRKAAELAPQDAPVAYEAGNIAALGGNLDDAKAAWTRAAQLAPQSDAGQAAAMALKEATAN
ncbi:hypothetical protein [Sphingomonas montanisoli]|uniref:Uncharacterized protein n=1 Tax=Sphingomonas montanisoli TaxID=2606412 RepID=A0A5D9C3H8_9SPHN|nr:hypothetical protein [Sphingomonas montanisoli]TZG26294.1 hypothetical protein FYJ91_15250 [Sphingomonas montanisoli]